MLCRKAIFRQPKWLFMILIVGLSLSLPSVAQQPLVFAVQNISHSNTQRISQEEYTKKMERKMGFPLLIMNFDSGCDLLKVAREGKADIITMTPVWVPSLVRDYGYKSVIKTDAPMSLLLVSHTDKQITRIEDLRGKRLASMPAGYTTSMLAKKLIGGIEGLADSIHYVEGTRELSLIKLIDGTVDAVFISGTRLDRIRRMPEKLKKKLTLIRVLSEDIPAAIFINKADIDDGVMESFRNALQVVPNNLGYTIKYLPFTKADFMKLESVMGYQDVSLCEE